MSQILVWVPGEMIASDKGNRVRSLGGESEEFGLGSVKTEGPVRHLGGGGFLGGSQNSSSFSKKAVAEGALGLMNVCAICWSHAGSLSSQ